jgi:hypothetical protein
MISMSDETTNKDIEDTTWYINCHMDNGFNAADYFIIAEAPDANDGPHADYYDAPKAPHSPPPYIYSYLDDNLTFPYDKLAHDVRRYPDAYKIYNLTISHDFNSPIQYKMNDFGFIIYFSWIINGTDKLEYSNIELINTHTNTHVSIINQNSWSIPVDLTGSSNYKIICDLIHIKLDKNWNFISPYCNIVNDKSDSLICFDNITIDWSEAVDNYIIVDSVFTWDNLNQSYIFSNTFNSGQGYWLYAHEPCYLWLKNYTVHTDDSITELEQDWNLIGSPFNSPVSNNNVTIEWNDTTYSWIDAINNGLISNTFYSWNTTIQSYEITDTFEPGKAYWLFAYEPCILEKIS